MNSNAALPPFIKKRFVFPKANHIRKVVRNFFLLLLTLLSFSRPAFSQKVYANSQENSITGICILCGVVNADNPSSNVISNSIIYGNMVELGSEAIFTNSIVKGGHAGAGNSGSNPMFVDPLNISYAPITRGDYNLQRTSPAINTGDNSKINAVVTDPLDPALLADASKGAGCSGLLCSVANPELAVDNTSYLDYGLLNIPVGLIGVTGNAQMDVSWTSKTIKAGDFVGFVIAQDNLLLNQALLSKIKIQLMDANGQDVTVQDGFTSYQTTTLDGRTVKYIGVVASTGAVTDTRFREWHTGAAGNKPTTQLTLPATSGLYIITLILPNGEKASVNVLSK